MTQQAQIPPAEPCEDEAPGDPDAAARSGERWTAAKMAAFLRTLSATHSVSAAARSVGMSRQSAYRLRLRLKGKPFDLAWDAAFHPSYQNLPYAALERALHGIEVPHYYKGEVVGTSRRYDERLTVALLKLTGNPATLAAGGDGAAARRQGERFTALLARVEAGGAEADGEPAGANRAGSAPAGVFRANPADLSPADDAAPMAELRGFAGRPAG